VFLNESFLAAWITGLDCVPRGYSINVGTSQQEYPRTNQVAPSCKSMVDILEVSSLVTRCKVCEFLIRLFSERHREQLIELAGIHEERSLALLDIDLSRGSGSGGVFKNSCGNDTHIKIFGFDSEWMGNGYCLNGVFERKVERKARCVNGNHGFNEAPSGE